MNTLSGHIENIKSNGNLTMVETNIKGAIFKAIIIGNASRSQHLKPKDDVELLFNESEVTIGKRFKGLISIGNKFECEVSKIKEGKIFTNITLNLNGAEFNSLITSSALKELEITVHDKVEAYIKINEIFLKYPVPNTL